MGKTSKQYIRVEWLHSFPQDPIVIYSEIDEERWEVRKVEVFADGGMFFSDGRTSTGTTGLGEVPIPSIEEIALDPQFKPQLITADAFEEVWVLATNP